MIGNGRAEKLACGPPISTNSDTYMTRRALFAFAVLLIVGIRPAFADWPMEFVRLTCIPEARYFRVEYMPVSGPSVLLESEFDDEKRAKRLLAWEKAGFHEPSNLTYECALPESLYKLTAHQPPPSNGECGGAPSISLSLFRNGQPILENVIFGNDCFGGPTVIGAEITDGLDGWDTRALRLCLSQRGAPPRMCEFLSETYGDITKAIPITQQKVAQYVEKRR